MSLRAWETTRSPSWPSGGKNPKRSGTPERSQTDVLNASSSSSVPPLMTAYRRTLTSTDRHFPTVSSSKSTTHTQLKSKRINVSIKVDQDRRLTYSVLAVISLLKLFIISHWPEYQYLLMTFLQFLFNES